MNLVLAEKPERLDRDLLFERAATVHLDLLDEKGKHPRLNEVAYILAERHQEYDEEAVLECLRAPDFETYLQGRRKTHLINHTAAKLVAAEMGSRIAVDALEQLQGKMEAGDVSAKDLVAIAKLGMDLNADVDKDLTAVTGDAKVTINLKNLLIGLPPDRAQVLMAEYGRAMSSPKAKAEIIDASSSSTEEE